MSDTGQTRSRIPLLLLAAIAVIGGFFGVRHLMNGDGPGPDEPDVDLARVAELRNLGLAWIENLEYDKAAGAFRELTELVPDERLPWQNLAIAELLKAQPKIVEPTAPEFPAILDSADKAITAFSERYGETAESHILRARHYLRQLPTASFEMAAAGMVESYRKALAIEDGKAFLHYQLFDAVVQSHDKSLEDEGFTALQRAWELDNNNLQLVRDLLPRQAEREDPGIIQSLEATRRLVKPYSDYVRKFAREDILGLVDRATAAAKEGNWIAARSASRGIGNVLVRAVGSMNDNETVKPHLLEFLEFHFSQKLEENLESFRREFPSAIPVSFSLASDELAIEPGIMAATTGDLNLDSKPDIVAVRAGGVEVLHQGAAAWETLMSLDQAGLAGVCVVDLDRDAVKQEHCWEADPDLIAFGPAGVFIVENKLDEASGVRTLVTREQTGGLTELKNVLAVLPVDFDHDGDLDLVVSTEDGMSSWLNLENWSFSNHSQHSQLPPAGAKIHSMIAVDWDRDVAIDVLCLGDGTAGRLSNILHGRLRWREFPDEASYLNKAATTSVLDADANFSWDVVSASPEGISVSTTMNPGAGVAKFTGRVSPVEEAAPGAS
nr:VCBS repeat-containing protein [Planctomycetota bacterium]